MPGAGTKQQQISEPTRIIAPTGEPQLTPSEVLSDFGQICVALPAGGALIAVRDLSGLRCTVSFGNAPAVGSRVPTDSAFIRQVFETGEVAQSEDIEGAPRDQEDAAGVGVSDLGATPASDADNGVSVPEIQPAATTRASFRSAVAMPILAQGSVVGLIAVFSSQLSAFSPTAIAGLQRVAKSFANLLIFDAANDGQPVIGGPLSDPIVLPKLLADQQPPSNVTPDVQATEEPASFQIMEKPISVETVEKPQSPEIPSPAAAMPIATRPIAITKPATLSQLPSDRPTPTRVWLIAAVLLLALSLLALFLFESASHKQDTSVDALSPPASDPNTH
jgi:hypothetical protein